MISLKLIIKTVLVMMFFINANIAFSYVLPNKVDSIFFAKSIKEALKDPLNVDYLLLTDYDTLPKEIFLLENLKLLILKQNKIKNLPEKIGQLKKLTWLSIENSNVFPYGIHYLLNLKRLELSNNNFNDISAQAKRINQFIELKIIGGKVPIGLAVLKNVYAYVLYNCDVKDNETLFCEFPNLVELAIVDVNYSRLPKCIGNLKKLVSLTIQFSMINSFPNSFIELKKIKRISLVQIDIHTILEFIQKLPSLEYLELIECENISKSEMEKIQKYSEARNFNLIVG